MKEKIFSKEIIDQIIKSSEIFEVKTVLSEDEMDTALRIRYDVFSRKLGWIVPNTEQRDFDTYDNIAKHVAVFLEEKMIGYCRLIFPDKRFMIEDEFKDLIPEGSLPHKKDAIEISRVFVDTSRVDYKLYTTMMIYREIYRLGIEENLRYAYIVVVQKFLEKIKRVFPFEQVGKTKYYSENVATVAAIIDCKNIERKFYKESRRLHSWYTDLKRNGQG
jgi:acyl homoserine lactone synthase